MKFLKTVAMLTLAFGMTISTSYAALAGYELQQGGQVYKYDIATLTQSFIGLEPPGAALYQDFQGKLSQGATFHSFSDDTGRYVDYAAITGAFMNNPEGFDVAGFVDNPSSPAPANMPSTVISVGVDAQGNVTNTQTPVDNGQGQADYVVTVKSGLTAFDRMVEVKLNSGDPSSYQVTVTVSGQTVQLQYVSAAGVFRGMVTSTDEAAIKAGVKVENISNQFVVVGID